MYHFCFFKEWTDCPIFDAAPNKENQDSYVVIPSYGSLKDQAFFAIFDGHGKDGHHCAKYARDHVNIILKDNDVKNLRQSVNQCIHFNSCPE